MLDLRKGDGYHASSLGLHPYGLFRDAFESADDRRATLNRNRGRDPYEMFLKTLIVGQRPQRPIEARRGDFQRVRMIDQVVDFDACADLSADVGTVVEADAARLVDKQGQ